MIEEARRYAARRHGAGLHGDGLAIDHVGEVAGNVIKMGITDPALVCTAWLHDVIEDTDAKYDDILDLFGREIADWVAALSKDNRLPRGRRSLQYAQQLAGAPWQVKVVKMADILANLGHVGDARASRLVPYIDAIRDGITPRRVPHMTYVQERLDSLLAVHGLPPIPLQPGGGRSMSAPL